MFLQPHEHAVLSTIVSCESVGISLEELRLHADAKDSVNVLLGLGLVIEMGGVFVATEAGVREDARNKGLTALSLVEAIWICAVVVIGGAAFYWAYVAGTSK